MTMKSGWYTTDIRSFKIESIVGWYDIWTGDLPSSQITAKVVQTVDDAFIASQNVFFKSKDGIEHTCGIGETVNESVVILINNFYREIEKHKAVDEVEESDFVWLCWTPFGATPFVT